ncbi:MAG: PEGA domain-containing protein [Proteobacteria bacterium]|nr:PEGA domain-containing protein [Pseudomonadota bacterium]
MIVELAGYDPLEQTINVTRSDTFTFTLVRSVPKATLRVAPAAAEQATGMELAVNGKPEGALPSSLTVAPGNYLVAVSKAGFKPWQQWITLGSGEQRLVTVTLEALAPQTGTLLVASNVAGAQVRVDDQPVGEAPALVGGLSVGLHAVAVSVEGREAQTASVMVEAGKTARAVLNFDQVPVAKTGTLQVLSGQRGLDVYVDGEYRGKAPLTLRDVAEGTHLVIAELPGHQPVEQRVVVAAGQLYALRLELQPVLVAPTPAVVPATPTAGVAPGSKPTPRATTPSTRAPVAAGLPPSAAPRRVPIHLVGADESDPVLLGAQLVSPRNFTADLALGFPYWGEGRLTTGVFSHGHYGLDAGVELRSTGAFTEFDAITKLRFLNHEAIAVAALLALGAGGGPNGRNTFFLNAGVVASLIFKRVLTFSGRVYGNFYTDRHCPSSAKSGELGVCAVDGARDRDGGARLMLSGALEIPMTTNLGLLAVVEGAPFQAQRKAFRDAYSSLMFESDPRIYGRLGVSFKF